MTTKKKDADLWWDAMQDQSLISSRIDWHMPESSTTRNSISLFSTSFFKSLYLSCKGITYYYSSSANISLLAWLWNNFWTLCYKWIVLSPNVAILGLNSSSLSCSSHNDFFINATWSRRITMAKVPSPWKTCCDSSSSTTL